MLSAQRGPDTLSEIHFFLVSASLLSLNIIGRKLDNLTMSVCAQPCVVDRGEKVQQHGLLRF